MTLIDNKNVYYAEQCEPTGMLCVNVGQNVP